MSIEELISHREEPPASIERAVLIRTDLADQYTTIAGPIGRIYVGFTSIGVSSIVPTPSEEEFLAAHERRVGRPAYRGELPSKLETMLLKTFESGKRGQLPVDLRPLTPFQQEVLEITSTIPPGEVRPYGWVAREMGNDGAVRAVGTALGRNPVPIAIPCHRVVRADGSIGNYAFGADMKHRLLEHEGMREFGRSR